MYSFLMELQYGNCVIKHTEYGHTVSAKISTTNSIFLEKMLLCTTINVLYCICCVKGINQLIKRLW